MIVVLPDDDELRRLVKDLPVKVVMNPRPADGIASSIRIGVHDVPEDAQGALIGVADQPRVDAKSLRMLMQAFRPGAIVTPRYGDVRGNPRIFDRSFFGELAGLTGDRGGQQVATAHPEAGLEVMLPEEMALDIDRPEDWTRLED